jgi:predicted YcjX-like family ATPase
MRRFPGTVLNEGDVEVQVIKESNEKLIFRTQTSIQNGSIDIPAVEGVSFDDNYRVVVLKPGSLPVQIINVRFAKTENSLEVPVFLPIDRNEDGKFSLSDLISSYSRN